MGTVDININSYLLAKNEVEVNEQHLEIIRHISLLGLIGCLFSIITDEKEYLWLNVAAAVLLLLLFTTIICLGRRIKMEDPGYKYFVVIWLFLPIIVHSILSTDFFWMAFSLPIIMSSRYYSKRFVLIISGIAQVVLYSTVLGIVYIQPLFGYARAGSMTLPVGYSIVGNGDTLNEMAADLLESGVVSRTEYLISHLMGHTFYYGLILICVSVVCYGITCQEIRNLQRQSELQEEKRRSDVELADSRNRIMASQIRPHFVFNVLNSVYELCEEDPEKAQEMLLSFSHYLRYDIDMLQQQEPIPFSREINMVENYLKLEQMRFGDRLRVEMKLGVVNFSIPPFTLQPLVENAVKHGICHKRGGGTVTISTEQTEDQVILRIADDGMGFDLQSVDQDGTNHVGLYNVKSRLESQMNAQLDIQTMVGEGTCITIRLPKRL